MRKKLSPLSPSSFNPVITSQTSDSEEHSVGRSWPRKNPQSLLVSNNHSQWANQCFPLLVCRRRSTSLQDTRWCLSWRPWTAPSPPPRWILLLSTPVPATCPECCPCTAASLTRQRPARSPLWTTPTPVRDSNSRRVAQSECWWCLFFLPE